MKLISSRGRRRPGSLLLLALVAGALAAPRAALPASQPSPGTDARGVLTPVKDPPGTERVIVFGGVDDADLIALHTAVGSSLIYRYEIIQGAAIAVPKSRVSRTIALATARGLNAERDMEIKADLTNSARTVHVKANGSNTGAWGLGYTGAGVTVAVIDSGIYAQHTSLDDLDDNTSTNDPKVVKFKDYVNNGGGGAEVAAYDDNDHGSHVAGIAAGTGGGTQNIGMAFRANLAGFKVFNSAGSGSSTNFIAALNWIVNNPNAVSPRIRVVNYSGGSIPVGGNNNGNSAQSLAIDAASDAGIVVAAAGGNGSQDGVGPNLIDGNVNIPADARKAIAVCSSNSANPPTAPTYSNWDSEGPTGDGRVKPDVCAPGDSVSSVNSPANGGATGGGPTSYASFGGTSMATPHVAGIVALMIQAVPTLTPAQVREVLYETALNYPSKNNDRGYGEVNARAAILLAIDRYGTPTQLSVNSGGPYTAIQGDTRTLSALPTGGQPPYSIAWDLDDNGSYETPGASVAFSNTSTLADYTVRVRVTDSAASPATVTATTIVTVVEAVPIFGDDVEGGPNGWVTGGVPEGTGWHQTAVRATTTGGHSWYAGNDASMVYAPRQNLTLTRQVDLAAGAAATSGQLVWRFKRSGSLEPTFDFLNARIREAGASVTTTLASWDNYDDGNLWTSHSFDITSFKGKLTEIEFQFTSDDFNDVPFVDATGPFVDDIEIIGTPPPPNDTDPPGAISGLAAGASGLASIPLSWRTTGDDGSLRTASAYDLRYSTSEITAANFSSATPVAGLPAPLPPGQTQAFTVMGLAQDTVYFFAVKALDEAANAGPISNVLRAKTLAPPPPGIPGWPETGGSATRAGTVGGRGSLAEPNLLQTLAMPSGVDASPLIADLDGDGKLDVVAVSDANASSPTTVRAYRQTPGGLAQMWSYAVPALAGQTEGFGNLAVGQLADGGPLEVAVYSNNIINAQAVTSNEGRLAVLNAATGAFIDDLPVATSDTSALIISVDAPPAIGDVNGDGVSEIVLIHHVGGTTPGSFLAGFTLTGGVLAERFDTNLTATSNWRSWALAELDSSHDGLEIVAAQNNIPNDGPSSGAVRVCTPNAGDAVCAQDIATTTGIVGVSVADLDGDGQPEIVANGRTGQSLNVIRTFPGLSRVSLADGFHWNTASLADVDADGKADIVNVAHSGTSTRFPEHDPQRRGDVTVRGFDGSAFVDKGTLARTPVPGASMHAKGGGSLVDFDGDSRPELVFGSADGRIEAISFNSPPASLWSLNVGANPQSPIAAGDVTGDGLLDLVAGTDDGRLLVIGAGPPASLVLTPAADIIQAGGARTYAVEAFDSAGNTLGDVSTQAAFRIEPNGSCTGSTCTATTAGLHTVTAELGNASGTASLQVTAGPLASIQIEPSSATIVAGGSRTYTAAGFDQHQNAIGDVTLTTAFNIDNGTCTQNTCTSTLAGTRTVTGTNGSAVDTAALAVTPGPLHHLAVTPAESTIVIGQTQTYQAEGRDLFDNSLGNVTGSTIFRIGPNGTCTANVCRPAAVGDHSITATKQTATGSALLHVIPDTIATIVISPDPATITAGQTQTYTTEGFDANNVSQGDVTAATVFTIAGGQCTGNVCRATTAGPHTVTGTVATVSDTATLNIVAGPITRLGLVPSVAGITPGGSRAYTATGFDAYNNVVSDVTSTTTFAIVPDGSCSANVCTASVYGRHTVTGSRSGATGSATLNVVPRAPVIQTPAAGSVQPATVRVSGTAPVGSTVSLYDTGAQRVGGVPVDDAGRWAVTLGFSHGSHTLTAYASVAGFTSTVSAARSFTADALAPVVTYRRSSGAPVQVYHPLQAVVVEGYARDADSTVDRVEVRYVRPSGQVVFFEVLACSTGCSNYRFVSRPSIDPGIYNVQTTAIDRVGNRSAIAEMTIATLSAVSAGGNAASVSTRGGVVE